jgi:hypothetical protein
MVEDVDVAPGVVGLLFAGSSSVAIANPIDAVLSAPASNDRRCSINELKP